MRCKTTATALTILAMLAAPALAQPAGTTGQGTSGLQQSQPGGMPQADLGTGAGVPRTAKPNKEQRRAARAERQNRRPVDPRDRAYQDGGTLGGSPSGPANTAGGSPANTTGQGTSSLRN